jgi:hypothetical protein
MAGINIVGATFGANLLLNFELGGVVVTASSPAQRALGLATGNPVLGTYSEIGTASGYARVIATFAGATSGTAINNNNMTFGPFSAACTIAGMHLWDTTAATAGNNLRFGTVAAARPISSGDSVIFNSGSLICTLT